MPQFITEWATDQVSIPEVVNSDWKTAEVLDPDFETFRLSSGIWMCMHLALSISADMATN